MSENENNKDLDEELFKTRLNILKDILDNKEIEKLKLRLKILEDTLNNNIKCGSHVGQIIFSSTLDSMEKVISVYGGKYWEKIEGKFLLGQSSKYKIGDTDFFTFNTSTPSNQTKFYRAVSRKKVEYTGGNQPHNNMSPYKVVYIWERVE